MPTECKGLVVDKANDGFHLRDIVLDDILPNEVLVKITACGICQTDLSCESGKIGGMFPGILGHEAGGVITEVGKDVKGLEVGDSVLMSFAFCGNCTTCKLGRLSTCETYIELNILSLRSNGKMSVGHQKESGIPIAGQWFGQSSLAEYAIVTPSACVKVPKGTDLKLLAPLGCGIQTAFNTVMNVLSPRPDQSIAIWGMGGVGCTAVAAAKHLGVKTIIALDLHDSRLELAKELGATHVINGKADDKEIMEQIKTITGGKMLNFTVEASGSEASYSLALRSLGRLGKHAQIGILTHLPRVENTTMAVYQIETVFVVNGDAVSAKFIPLLVELVNSGALPLQKYLSFFPLADHKKAVAGMRDGSVIKAVITFD